MESLAASAPLGNSRGALSLHVRRLSPGDHPVEEAPCSVLAKNSSRALSFYVSEAIEHIPDSPFSN